MSNLDTALSQRHRLSIWHVYRSGLENLSITPFLVPEKEYGNSSNQNRTREDGTSSGNHSARPSGYFVQHPSLLFHNTPRVLRRGHEKGGDPICIIKLGAFWRSWLVQFSDDLKEVIDPRGLVRWECRSNSDNSISNDREWKGYKVRSWRVWGESGGEYHRMVNARRKALKEEEEAEGLMGRIKGKTKAHDLEMGVVKGDSDLVSASQNGEDSDDENAQQSSSTPSLPTETSQRYLADEALRLQWRSPFSINTRNYCFEYAGIQFSWEGTRDIHSDHGWNRNLLPFNHLNLVSRIPGPVEEDILVAQYISSFSNDKHGQLWVFDSAITRLLEKTGHPSKWIKITENNERFSLDIYWDVRQTRLYDIVMATSMCMIIGEWQKRAILWMFISTLYSAAVLGIL
ncbi:unnamed protein product [Penicillium salamii]|uniref:Uncharacterized protein n=1 Tax=Penicillium salamii TaxID=1612424 RepID=A0A9W4NUV2_9EURO|nr:unnamed protein product [Penicillium salamii]CAG8006557.1 unnamed protein product [Penicillium salamii]CAG8252307.1 unnamed protein product [Penicillium salamii]CAG8267801.1 unnamed protein product [Penicillium salamii]CAG8274442.1 unnamed protein product [Penicillium salamii]